MKLQDELAECYRAVSKHSQYQAIHPDILPFIDGTHLEVRSKWEAERMAAISASIPLEGGRVLDIGANTGYFSFAALRAGCKSVLAVEGCAAHAHFIQAAAEITGRNSALQVENRYYGFESEPEGKPYDATFLLNVLHHLGDDYGDATLGKEAAKQRMLHALNLMAERTRCMAFQMGFNWKGNRELPLFDKGTKTEMIDFVKNAVGGYWEVDRIWIAVRYSEGGIVYEPLSESNIQREDALGEFLNRPLFILRSVRI